IARAPNAWAIARVADSLGLAERVTSGMYARAAESAIAGLVRTDAHQCLASLDPRRYEILDDRRAAWAVAASLIALAVLTIALLPSIGNRAAEASERQSIAIAQRHVEAMEL